MSTYTESSPTTTRPAARPAPRSLLRLALKLDAVVTAANGAAYVVAAEPLGDLLGLSPALLRGAGASLLLFAGLVWLAATRASPSRAAVLAIVAANVLWAIDSIVLAAAGWGSPTAAGTVWVVLQAGVVAGFAALQVAGLGRQR